TGLWGRLWWISLFGNFLLVVLAAERIGRSVPPRHRRAYELALAIGFPVAAIVSWQLIVDAGILDPLWFPQPSRIAAAFWELTVSYDRFSQTSLFGRPWLFPQAFAADGWSGVLALFTESHVLATLGRVLVGFV